MATTLVDLVKIYSNSAGTTAFVLGDAVPGFFGVDELIDGSTYSYCVQQGALKEYGYGVYDASAGTLTRQVIKSQVGTDPVTDDPVPFNVRAEVGFVLLSEDLGGGGGGGAIINDNIISTGFVWSSSKTDQQINTSAATLAASVSSLAIATSNALALKQDVIAPGLNSQYWRGDKTWQTLDKTAVGLGNVDNTSDANKPVSTPQAAALALKDNLALTIATIASTTFTLTATYKNKTLETTASTPVVAVFDPTLTAGSWGYVTQRGTGQVSFAITGTGTIRGLNRSLGQWSVIRWYCSANSDGSSAEIVLSDETMGYDFQTINMLAANPGLAINEGLAYDGSYLYVTPHNGGIVAKVDPVSFSIVATLDLNVVDPTFIGMSDSFASGGYLYILPHFTSSGPYYQKRVVRVDLANFTTAGITSLEVIAAPDSVNTPRDGFTDGTSGFINVRTNVAASIIRFGLGASFNSGSVSRVTLTATTGVDGAYPIKAGNFLCCDTINLYGVVRAATVSSPTVIADLWLVTIPLNNFQASAAVFTRITNQNFVAPAVPDVPFQLVDDGANLWTFPLPLVNGSGYVAPIKIPKAAPGTATITTPPAGQQAGTSLIGSGQAIYDGQRFGYAASNSEDVIVQLDTQRPGVLSYISAAGNGGQPMWGLEKAGNYGYAASFTGAQGLLMRFTLLQ